MSCQTGHQKTGSDEQLTGEEIDQVTSGLRTLDDKCPFIAFAPAALRTHLSVGAAVPGGVDGHVGAEQREAAREALRAREAAVGRARQRREPQVVVRQVLRPLRLQNLQREVRGSGFVTITGNLVWSPSSHAEKNLRHSLSRVNALLVDQLAHLTRYECLVSTEQE